MSFAPLYFLLHRITLRRCKKKDTVRLQPHTFRSCCARLRARESTLMWSSFVLGTHRTEQCVIPSCSLDLFVSQCMCCVPDIGLCEILLESGGQHKVLCYLKTLWRRRHSCCSWYSELCIKNELSITITGKTAEEISLIFHVDLPVL